MVHPQAYALRGTSTLKALDKKTGYDTIIHSTLKRPKTSEKRKEIKKKQRTLPAVKHPGHHYSYASFCFLASSLFLGRNGKNRLETVFADLRVGGGKFGRRRRPTKPKGTNRGWQKRGAHRPAGRRAKRGRSGATRPVPKAPAFVSGRGRDVEIETAFEVVAGTYVVGATVPLTFDTTSVQSLLTGRIFTTNHKTNCWHERGAFGPERYVCLGGIFAALTILDVVGTFVF